MWRNLINLIRRHAPVPSASPDSVSDGRRADQQRQRAQAQRRRAAHLYDGPTP